MTEVRIEFEGGKATRCTVDGRPVTFAEAEEAIRKNAEERERHLREKLGRQAVRQ